MQFIADESETDLLDRLRQYFTQRAYQVAAIEPDRSQIRMSGLVRPSRFLAIFLSLLAAVGLLCLALVLGLLLPDQASLWLGLPLLSPLAGVFYWRQAGRPEEVAFRIEPMGDQDTAAATTPPQSRLTVMAHRDELIALQRSLPLKEWEAEST